MFAAPVVKDIDMSRFARASMALGAALATLTPLQAQTQMQMPRADKAAAGPLLSLQDALALASGDQPSVTAFKKEAEASDQGAVAAEALPDMQLTTGIEDFPFTGSNALTVNDMMTMLTVGVMREQVRRSKREAEAARIRAVALASRKQASAEDRRIRREVSLAWIDAVEAHAKQSLLRRMIEDLHTGHHVMEAGVQTGMSTPALALQMDAEIALEESELAQAKDDEAHARGELARWIGAAADRPLPDTIPAIELPAELLPEPAIADHPAVQLAQAKQQEAQRAIDVAREARKPDLTWSVMAGFRPKYGEMISGTVSIPLQLNRRNNQDRLVAEAQLKADAASLRVEDARRDLERDYRTARADYDGAGEQLERINQRAIPALEAAFKAAEARYEGGGDHDAINKSFEIVREYIDTSIKSLETRAKRARAAAQIIYIIGETGR